MTRFYNAVMRNASYAFFIIAVVLFLVNLLSFKQSFFLSISAAIWSALVPLAISAIIFRIDIWLEKSR